MEPKYPREDRPTARCDRCGGEIYENELVHVIDGFVICAECFEEYACEYFESCMVVGGELGEMRCSYDA